LINFKSRLTKKERERISDFINETNDVYSDFYITRNNCRLYVKENVNILFDGLKKGNKIAFNENGLIIVLGWSDNFNRHYIKFLTKDENTAEELLRVLSWNLNIILWTKIKKRNPIINVLKRNGFKFVGSRGQEILLKREPKK